MNSKPEDDEPLRRYLLRELSEPEAELLEQRLIEEDNLFEQCEALETDLLAAADRGELAPEERGRVLRRLASSPQGRERFEFARELNKAADDYFAWWRTVLAFLRTALARKTAFWSAAAAAAAALIVTIGLLVPKPPPVVATYTISFASLRGAEEVQEVQKIEVQPDVDFVVLQLDVEGWEDAGSFHAVVRKKGMGTVWQGDLQPEKVSWGPALSGPALVLKIPVEQLAAGRYEVEVTAGSEDLTQQFTIVRGSRG